MALAIKNNKVVTIVPPKKLSSEERSKLVNTPVNEKLIKKATSRTYNIVQLILIEIKKYNSITAEYQFSKKLLESLNLSENLEQRNREELFIKDICKFQL